MREAADRLPGKPATSTVRDRIKRGQIKGVYDGRRWYTTPEAISEYLRCETRKRTVVPVIPTIHATAESILARLGKGVRT